MSEQQAIIIGAGPAGLTAALELLRRTGITPIVLEASQEIGGISRTVKYRGNRMDIGGHRFFSKSDRVMDWWAGLMPVEQPKAEPSARLTISYQGQHRDLPIPRQVAGSEVAHGRSDAAVALADPLDDNGPEGDDPDLVMLVRSRTSRIYFLRRFFDYPLKLSGKTLRHLGSRRVFRIGVSYLAAQVWQRRPENSLEDFLINRFGRELYRTFFKSYTEKVWGTPCNQISAEWGAQRIKGLNLTGALKHFLKSWRSGEPDAGDVTQKTVDTSLIERFLYPRLGPGQLWEHVADLICGRVPAEHQGALGNRRGHIHMGWKVVSIQCDGKQISSVTAQDTTGQQQTFRGDYFFSTMPIRDLLQGMRPAVPAPVRQAGDGLQYRDFITVGLLCDRLKVHEEDGSQLRDNWIYIQEPDVRLGRLQIFNNWSPHLVADPDKIWIGLEYFCAENDDLWRMSDEALKSFAIAEIEKIGLLEADAVADGCVVRVPKAYPAYFGTYDRFPEVRSFVDTFENLFLIGRNGMHRYNNQDHSMLTAMMVVDGLVAGHVDKQALWTVNTEQDYHESK